jgi:C_GCAxxG_C_C family probable redox protein
MTSQNDILEHVYQRAFHYETTRGNCPQCVLAALKETLNIGNDSLIQASQGLAGGTALSSKGTCGALSGGIIALGTLIGRTYQEFTEGQKNRLIYKYTKHLYDKFISEYGSPLCCDVQKKIFGRSYVLFDQQDYDAFQKAGGHIDKCPSVSGNAAKWTAEIILNEIKPNQAKG